MRDLRVGISILALAFIVGACASAISYEPSRSMDPEEAREAVIRALEEQPANFRPQEISIDDEAVRLGFSRTRRSLLAGGVAVIDFRDTFYLSNLKPPKLVKRKGRYQVLLSNVDETVVRWTIFHDEQRAKLFVDALATLVRIAHEDSLAAP